MEQLNKDNVDKFLKQFQASMKQLETDFGVKIAFRQITWTSDRLAGRLHVYTGSVAPLCGERPPTEKVEETQPEPTKANSNEPYVFKKDWHRELFEAFAKTLPEGSTEFTTEDMKKFVDSQTEHKWPYWYTLGDNNKLRRGVWRLPKV